MNASISIKPNFNVQKTQSNARKALAKTIDRAKTTLKKRIKRLENNNLTDAPAYKQYMLNEDVIKFSVKGKTTQELQSEYWKLKRLLDLKTGTVKGANETLKQIANITNIKYKNLNELKSKSKLFFELADKLENIYTSMGETAKAIDYRKIWQDVEEIMKQERTQINNALKDISELNDEAIEGLSDSLIAEFSKYIENELFEL